MEISEGMDWMSWDGEGMSGDKGRENLTSTFSGGGCGTLFLSMLRLRFLLVSSLCLSLSFLFDSLLKLFP